MTMDCNGVPDDCLFVIVLHPDPDLNVTPNTGAMSVQGSFVVSATCDLGYETLVVRADVRELLIDGQSLRWPSKGECRSASKRRWPNASAADNADFQQPVVHGLGSRARWPSAGPLSRQIGASSARRRMVCSVTGAVTQRRLSRAWPRQQDRPWRPFGEYCGHLRPHRRLHLPVVRPGEICRVGPLATEPPSRLPGSSARTGIRQVGSEYHTRCWPNHPRRRHCGAGCQRPQPARFLVSMARLMKREPTPT